MVVTAEPTHVSRAERMKTGRSPTVIGSSVPKNFVERQSHGDRRLSGPGMRRMVAPVR